MAHTELVTIVSSKLKLGFGQVLNPLTTITTLSDTIFGRNCDIELQQQMVPLSKANV